MKAPHEHLAVLEVRRCLRGSRCVIQEAADSGPCVRGPRLWIGEDRCEKIADLCKYVRSRSFGSNWVDIQQIREANKPPFPLVEPVEERAKFRIEERVFRWRLLVSATSSSNSLYNCNYRSPCRPVEVPFRRKRLRSERDERLRKEGPCRALRGHLLLTLNGQSPEHCKAGAQCTAEESKNVTRIVGKSRRYVHAGSAYPARQTSKNYDPFVSGFRHGMMVAVWRGDDKSQAKAA